MCWADRCLGSSGRRWMRALAVVTFLVPLTALADSSTRQTLLPANSSDFEVTGDLRCEQRDVQSGGNGPVRDLLQSVQRDPKRCFVSAGSSRFVAQSMVIVDIRSKDEFEDFRAAGSINLPLYAVQKKPFLRDRPVLLVGSAHVALDHPSICDQLQRAGLDDAKVLDKGVAAWVLFGGRILGKAPSVRELFGVEPAKVSQMRPTGSFLVIADSENSRLGKKLFSEEEVRLLEPISTAKDLVNALNATLKEKSGVSVLIAESGSGPKTSSDSDGLNAYLLNHDIFFLRGGATAYQDYLNKQKALLARPEGGISSVKRCAG